jgi:3D (Asp-Asp-Asp) domain-containing protein
MKTISSSVFCAALCAMAVSCSMDGQRTAQLKTGVQYELRQAARTDTQIDPHQLRSVYFVLKPNAEPKLGGVRSMAGENLKVRTTAYCHSESDHLVYGQLSAVGRPLRFGMVRSAAADWSRFPVGTRFRVKSEPSVVYEVDDYGSALVGTNTIDIYCPTRRQMDKWGVRQLDIEVVKWGSYEKSAELMRDRVAFSHVRQMLNSIQSMPQLSASSFSSGVRDNGSMTMVSIPGPVKQ